MADQFDRMADEIYHSLGRPPSAVEIADLLRQAAEMGRDEMAPALRDQFAGRALQGAIAHYGWLVEEEAKFSMHAYRMADAMLSAREDQDYDGGKENLGASDEVSLLRSALRFALREAKRTPFNAEEYDAAAALLKAFEEPQG